MFFSLLLHTGSTLGLCRFMQHQPRLNDFSIFWLKINYSSPALLSPVIILDSRAGDQHKQANTQILYYNDIDDGQT